MADLSKIPLVALSIDTRTLVSTFLNPTKWVPTDDGIPRDWRGLAHLSDLGGETIPSLASHSDPTGRIITILETKTADCTLETFKSILSKIDRWDVIDDANSLFERDAEKYLDRLERCKTSADEIVTDADEQILTVDDVYRFRQGLDKQCYDAFLLYSDKDMDFITELIENLETKHNLKLCIKDRDLIGGISFEHEAVMQLISERCNRMIVVISPNFLESPANKFFLNYAQAVGIETRQRKIVPCLYKKCQLPRQLCYTFILDYSKIGLYDFWGKLRDSVSVVTDKSVPNRELPSQKSLQKVESPLQKDEIVSAIQNENTPIPSMPSSIACSNTTKSKSGKTKKAKTFLPWSTKKKKKLRVNGEDEAETAAGPISLTVSLPSLDNLPSLEIVESASCSKPTKRKKNLVGSCVEKVQALLSK